MSLPTGLRRRAVAIVLAAMVAGFGIVATSPESATAASKCTTMRRPIHLFLHRDVRRERAHLGLLVLPVLKKAGYVDLGVTFKAGGPAKGLSAVHELWNPKSFDRIYSRSATEIAGIKKTGYVDRGVAFYAATQRRFLPVSGVSVPQGLGPPLRRDRGRPGRAEEPGLDSAERGLLAGQARVGDRAGHGHEQQAADGRPGPDQATPSPSRCMPDTQQRDA